MLNKNRFFIHAPPWLIALALGVIATALRCVGLHDFFTVDESFHWVWRVMHFVHALEKHNWAGTNLTGHPGVTTLWLGAAGRWLAAHVGLYGPEWEKGSIAYLALLRLPLAFVNSMTVAIGYIVLQQLVCTRTAILAGILWATAPFLIAHSRLLHLDALLTSCMTLSVLFLLWALQKEPTHTHAAQHNTIHAYVLIALSGLCAGLALLTKAPSLLLLPLTGLFLVAFGTHKAMTSAWTWMYSVRWLSTRYALWLLCAIVLFVAGWPAMWEAPDQAIGHIIEEVVDNGGHPHESGNYFLGKPVADPGWLFYPAVVVWRSGPFTLIGLLLLPLALRHMWLHRKEGSATTPRTKVGIEPPKHQERQAVNKNPGATHCPVEYVAPVASASCRTPARSRCYIPLPTESTNMWFVLALVSYVVLFGIAMSMLPKKFDRYLLPVWPAMEVLAAVGFVWFLDWSHTKSIASRMAHYATYIQNYALLIVAVVMLLINIWYHPYTLAYFNPLVGGGATAQHVMLVGWGEGMDKVATWLRSRPDVARSPIISWNYRTLEPLVPVRVVELNALTIQQPASYAVLYKRGIQRDEQHDVQAYIRQTMPLYTLRMYGIAYASVYQPIRPFDTPLDVVFAKALPSNEYAEARLHLRGFTHSLQDSVLTITPSWNVQADMPGGWFCFIHVLNANGERVAQVDAPLDEGVFTTWQAGQQFGSPLPVPLPDSLPSGEYHVLIGVYHPSDSARLPIVEGTPMPEDVDGPGVVQLIKLTLP